MRNIEKRRASQRAYYHRNKALCRIRRLRWYAKRGAEVHRAWRAGHHDKVKEQLRRYANKLKRDVVDAYGGRCVCCGEMEVEFLTIEHLMGDGKVDRKMNGIGSRFYRYLRKSKYPKDKYTVLCLNCNFATRLGRVCPHEHARLELAA